MLSVVLAVHNEEKNLSKCLKSVVDFADEIIIVDGESTDKTVEIAKKFTSHILTTSNKSNFHINKQMGIDAAKGELILQLDADEIVDETLARYIKHTHAALIEGEKVPTAAWWINRKNLFLGRYLTKGGQYPDAVIRLFQKGKARLPQKDVHEQMEVDGPIATAQGHLIHNSNPTFADYMRKFNTYTSFTAETLFKKGTTPSFRLALTYLCKLPVITFFRLYIRHRGYVDGVPGFVFALMSSLHFPIAYLKLWELVETT